MNATNRKYLNFCYLLVCLYILPLIIMGEDSHLKVLDFLDSVHVAYKILAESGLIFGSIDSQLNNLLNGIPRNTFFSEFNPLLWLMFLFGPLNSILVEQALVHLTAFFGMHRLLSRYFLQDIDPKISMGIALAFSFLPYMAHGMSLAAQPLALAAFLAIRQKKDRWHDWLVIGLFPVFTSLILTFGFICLLGGLWLADYLKNRNWNLRYIGGIGLMGLIYCCVEYRLIYIMFIDSQFISHRTEYDPTYNKRPFSGVFLKAAYMYTYGYHATITFQHKIIFYASLFALVFPLLAETRKKLKLFLLLFGLMILVEVILRSIPLEVILRGVPLEVLSKIIPSLSQKIFNPNASSEIIAGLSLLFALGLLAYTVSFRKFDWILSCHIILVGVALFWGLSHWEGIVPLKNSLPFLKAFTLKRLDWLYPFLWYLVFGLALKVIISRIKWGKSVAVGLILLQLSYLIFNHPVFLWRSEPTYKQYYSQQLFSEVAQFIGRNQKDYRIVNIGINPAVTLYNGFYNLDGYWVNYPLEHKHAFRKIMAGELEKNPKNRLYFDSWGSRCKIFVDKLTPYQQEAYKRLGIDRVADLQINVAQFKKMGGEYIISAVLIENFKELGLQLLKIFEDSESAWKVHLYKAK